MSSGQRAVAHRLHSAALHLLRALRAADDESPLSPARLSALSVLVFAGPRTLGELAKEERVTPASMSRLVRSMEDDGLVRRRPDKEDRRAVQLRASAKGRRALERARERRIDMLLRMLGPLSPHDERLFAEVADRIHRKVKAWGLDD